MTAAAAEPTPVGLWKTIDDTTSQPKGLVRISERNGQFEGKIEKIFPKPGDDPAPKCDKCDGTRHNQPVLGMTIRNAGLDSDARGSAGRASVNFVQGSWPNYHPAANAVSKGDPVAIAIIQEIDAENAALVADPRAGLKRIGARMAEDPAWYAEWYASKPWVLWGWKIRLGASDIHYHVVQNSLLERNAALRSIVAIYRWCTPALTTITLAAGLVLMLIGLRRRSWVPAAAVGALAIYLTLVHVVLQAEPRYATAYRGLEAVLVATALAWLVAKVRDAKLIRRMSANRVTRRVTL